VILLLAWVISQGIDQIEFSKMGGFSPERVEEEGGGGGGKWEF